MLALHQVIHNGDHIEQKGGSKNSGKTVEESSGEVLAMRKEIELLRAQVEELKERNMEYFDLILKLTEKK